MAKSREPSRLLNLMSYFNFVSEQRPNTVSMQPVQVFNSVVCKFLCKQKMGNCPLGLFL